jgi:2-oxoglutarate ferredoxin oxidoreductase subunit alpha
VPAVEDLPTIRFENRTDKEGFWPYLRDPDTLARPWAVPGTPGLEHRVGGLEKQDITGAVSYDPENHHRMQELRAEKVARIASDIPDLQIFGPTSGDLLIVGWGSTFGAIRSATERLQAAGRSVAHAHIRHLNPLPTNTGDVLAGYRRVLVPEVNLGQLLLLLRAKFLIDAVGYDKVRGKPLRIAEIEERALELMDAR